MAHHAMQEDAPTFCSLSFFDCLPSTKTKKVVVQPDVVQRSSGVEREMKVMYTQAHLVEPMKLRVFDDLPPPTPRFESPGLPQWMTKASSRASRLSLKKAVSKQLISRPIPQSELSNSLPLRRRQEYRPLELSIYMENVHRLSDLPAFDRLSFTEHGDIKPPPKAVVRTQSQPITPTRLSSFDSSPHKAASMFEVGGAVLNRPGTAYSVASISRPPSEYEALHSHPVSWVSLPGTLQPAKLAHAKTENSVAILTPMQEEFSHTPTTVKVGETLLEVPEAGSAQQIETVNAPIVNQEPTAQEVSSGSPSQTKKFTPPSSLTIPPYFHTNFNTQKRISQWLSYRSHSTSASTSSFKTTSTTSSSSSFAEHRRKRSEFYQVGRKQNPASPAPTTNVPDAPLILNFDNTAAEANVSTFSRPNPYQQHNRTPTQSTDSTDSTVDTSIMSLSFEPTIRRRYGSQDSLTTMTTMYTVPETAKSRTGTIKSFASPIIVEQNAEFGLNLSGYEARAEIIDCDMNEDMFIDEIQGPLRSPGVGVAF